jgi:hypothetical protein
LLWWKQILNPVRCNFAQNSSFCFEITENMLVKALPSMLANVEASPALLVVMREYLQAMWSSVAFLGELQQNASTDPKSASALQNVQQDLHSLLWQLLLQVQQCCLALDQSTHLPARSLNVKVLTFLMLLWTVAFCNLCSASSKQMLFDIIKWNPTNLALQGKQKVLFRFAISILL